MKVLFLDRDGTLIHEPPDGYIDSLEKLKILPGVIKTLKDLQRAGYRFVMISNQPGRGTPRFPEENFSTPQNELMRIFTMNGITFEGTFFCPHYREENCACMKPKTGLIETFLHENEIDFGQSFVIGDRDSDIKLAKNIGCRSIAFSQTPKPAADMSADSWSAIRNFILGG